MCNCGQSSSGKGLYKGAMTSKTKHAIKHKTSPARLAQLLQPSLAFYFSFSTITTLGLPVAFVVSAISVVTIFTDILK